MTTMKPVVALLAADAKGVLAAATPEKAT